MIYMVEAALFKFILKSGQHNENHLFPNFHINPRTVKAWRKQSESREKVRCKANYGESAEKAEYSIQAQAGESSESGESMEKACKLHFFISGSHQPSLWMGVNVMLG